MAKETGRLTPTQLRVMNLFWEHGELGVAQAWKLLDRERRVARNTVQTTLTRLAHQGWLRARREGNADVYRAARPRKFVMRKMLGQLIDTVFAGSTSGLIATLLENRRISADDAARIRELIDLAEKQQ